MMKRRFVSFSQSRGGGAPAAPTHKALRAAKYLI
jgi:hypothetical protein